MIILGVDPGLRTSGYAVIEQHQRQLQVVDAGTFRADTEPPLPGRLLQIYRDIDALLKEHDIDIMAIEQLYAHYKHPRTAILMGHARGMFLLAAAEHNIAVDEYAATRIKKSLTGSGRAGKEQMQRSVMSQLSLARLPTPDDVADALAVAMCCINEHNRQEIIL
jgi:crossover junction endodeoxyribonuclease RuvC